MFKINFLTQNTYVNCKYIKILGGLIMAVENGKIPTGTIVTGVGVTMLALEVVPIIAAGIVGFGLAHIVLGSIDVAQQK